AYRRAGVVARRRRRGVLAGGEVLHFDERVGLLTRGRVAAIYLLDAHGNLVGGRNGEANLPASGEAEGTLTVDVERIGGGDEQFLFGRRERDDVKAARPTLGDQRHGVRRGATQVGDREAKAKRQSTDVGEGGGGYRGARGHAARWCRACRCPSLECCGAERTVATIQASAQPRCLMVSRTPAP